MGLGGSRPDFVGSVSTQLKCHHCDKVLLEPMQTVCGHRFCKACIQGKDKCPFPDCKQAIDDKKVHEDFIARKEVEILQVYCNYRSKEGNTTSNPGCQELIKWKDLEEHCKTCKFKPLDCSFQVYGCKFKAPKKEMKDHIKDTVSQHLSMVLKQMRKQEENEIWLKRQISILTTKAKSAEETQVQDRKQIKDLTAKVEALEQQMQKEKLQVSETAQQRIEKLEARIMKLEAQREQDKIADERLKQLESALERVMPVDKVENDVDGT